MITAFRYKMYPNTEQVEALEETLETHRRIYNDGLAERKNAYESEKRSVSVMDQSKALTARRGGNPYLLRVGADSAGLTLRRLDKAYKNFFRRVKQGLESPGYPKFKRHDDFKTVEYRWGKGAKLEGNRAYFIHIGKIKTKVYRPLVGTPRTVSFSRDAAGWWVIVTCETEAVTTPAHTGPEVGIDFGIKTFIALSDGETVPNPAYRRNAQERIGALSEALVSKQPGSKRRQKARLALAKEHLHVANQRQEYQRLVAKDLTTHYGTIAHEALDIKDLAQRGNGKGVLDAAWGKFVTALESAASRNGTALIPVDAAYTSQTCSACGVRREEPLTLKDRTFTCPACGHSEDRDINAAKNIKARAHDESWGVDITP